MRYTNAVLTVIAVALLGVLAAEVTPRAQAQGPVACGTTQRSPCYFVYGMDHPGTTIQAGHIVVDSEVLTRPVQ